MSLQPITIAGYQFGLQTNQKPFLIPDQAFITLENAYVWRERVKKREGLKLLGRLRRALTAQNLGNTDGAGNFSGNIISILSLESSSEIEQGSISITVGAQVFTEPATPNGTLTNGAGGTGTINYATGALTLDTNPNLAAIAVIIDFNYFPGLPCMGIWQREIVNANDEQTIFFDTKYAYIFSGGGFQEFIPGTTWSANDFNFFYCSNYRGSTPDIRLFFATNFICNTGNPIRYTDSATWTNFAPLVDATHTLFQARIIIPYYGRLLALNVFEGTTAGGYAGAVNIYNRCRFSQIGDPTAVDAWRSDQFGKGGFIDAPTNESIVSATFFKNTLIVFFERSTWQLRYVGEYGLPFIWERISSDFGSDSTFSSVLFDEGILTVGDRAITKATATSEERIDLQIPDLVFGIKNEEHGPERVHGIRDFQRELVFWCYPDSNSLDEEVGQKFPNKTIVYNYRNNTYAIFRNNVTCYGTYQSTTGITWDSLDVFWDDYEVTWDSPITQAQFPSIVSGNQQGYVHYYGYTTQDEASLRIKDITIPASSSDPVQLTIIDHNLQDDDIIYLTGIMFTSPLTTDLNNRIFLVEVIDANTVELYEWDFDAEQYISDYERLPASGSIYIGGGQAALFPLLNVVTKDFNPYQSQGMQLKLSYIDFLTDATFNAIFTVYLFLSSSQSVQGNLIIGNTQSETYLQSPYYLPESDYAWHRFFATSTGQYIRIQLTYDDDLMNSIVTHQQDWILNAMTLYIRPGSKNVL